MGEGKLGERDKRMGDFGVLFGTLLRLGVVGSFLVEMEYEDKLASE